MTYICTHEFISLGFNVGFIYLFGFNVTFNCTGHVAKGSLKDTGNQYTQLVKVLYCKLPTVSKQLSTFPHEVWGLNADFSGER